MEKKIDEIIKENRNLNQQLKKIVQKLNKNSDKLDQIGEDVSNVRRCMRCWEDVIGEDKSIQCMIEE